MRQIDTQQICAAFVTHFVFLHPCASVMVECVTDESPHAGICLGGRSGPVFTVFKGNVGQVHLLLQ